MKNYYITSAQVLMPGSRSKDEMQYLPLQNSRSSGKKVEKGK